MGPRKPPKPCGSSCNRRGSARSRPSHGASPSGGTGGRGAERRAHGESSPRNIFNYYFVNNQIGLVKPYLQKTPPVRGPAGSKGEKGRKERISRLCLFFKSEAALAAGDTDAALASGHPHDLAAAGAAEKSVVLPLGKAGLAQTEPAAKPLRTGQEGLIFRRSLLKIPGENALVVPDV